MSSLVLIRHGQSTWNQERRFTGWSDIDLSERGIREAHSAGELLRDRGYSFDVAYTSVLKRAIRTLWIVMDEMSLMWIPVCRSWRLNEMCLGELEGFSLDELTAMYGPEQVLEWCRSYKARPPALSAADPRHPGRDPRYAHLDMGDTPFSESQEDALGRLLPLWEKSIASDLRAGKSVLVSSHSSILRALIMHIEGVSDLDVWTMDIPNGTPIMYEMDENLWALRCLSPRQSLIQG